MHVNGNASAVKALAVAAALATTGWLRAQDVGSPPTFREQRLPDQPTDQFGMPIEGWVKVRYTVRADGTTADVRVMDTMPPQLRHRDAVKAVEEWTFFPATYAGQPIDWHNNESTIVFDDESVPLEPNSIFSQAYLAVVELFGEQEYEKAKAANERLLATGTSRLNEIGLAQTQSALVNAAIPDIHSAYDAIRRATEPNAVTLQPEELRQALQYRFAIEVELGRLVEALDTFARHEGLGELADDSFAAQARVIEDALNGGAQLVVRARIDRDFWPHVPSRRSFTLADIDGEVREIEVECNRRKARLAYMPDVDWTLPESWGDCTLFVFGRRNTTFSVFEFK